MYKLGGSDEYVTCPYNKAHEVQRIRFQAHILRCRKQYPNIELATCFYNVKHLVKPEDMPKHLAECADKQLLEGSRYGSSVATTSFLEQDDDKEESVVSFGSDFIDSLPSNDDSSSVVSKKSSVRGRANALLKTGPSGNMSRYANNQRKMKWENAEIDFLECYDQVVSNYNPASISPYSSPEKKNVEPLRRSPSTVEKKIEKNQLKPIAVTAEKKSEEDELKPLPLPKTTSKAFASAKKNLQDDLSAVEVKNESQIKNSSKVNCDKEQKSKEIKKKEYVKYYEKDYDSDSIENPKVNYDAFIFNPVGLNDNSSKFDSSYRRNKFLNGKYDKIIGRGAMISESDFEWRPSGSIPLIPDVSDLDGQVPKRSTESKVFLKSGYSLFPDHENDGSMNDDTTRYEDADEENEDQDEQEEDDSNESPLLIALNKFVKKKEASLKENKFLASRDTNSSDETTTDSDCQSVSSVIQRKAPSPAQKKVNCVKNNNDDELSIFRRQEPPIHFPMGRGFRVQKKENIRPIGRGFNIL